MDYIPWVNIALGHRVNSLRPRKNGRLFADDTFKRIFLNENITILTKNSLKFVPKGLINNIPALVLIMAWRRPGDKPLSEPMLVSSLTHICVTRPQWVNPYEVIVFVNPLPQHLLFSYQSPFVLRIIDYVIPIVPRTKEKIKIGSIANWALAILVMLLLYEGYHSCVSSLIYAWL